jgi:type VI secretion system protein VasG
MIRVKLDRLVGRLNGTTHAALERAVTLCHAQRHYQVEVEHLFAGLLDGGDNDFVRIARACEIDAAALLKETAATLGRLKASPTSTVEFSQRLEALLLDAWTCGSIDFRASQVRSGFLLLAALRSRASQPFAAAAPAWSRFDADRIYLQFGELTAGSPEEPAAETAAGPLAAGGRPADQAALAQFTQNLTEMAASGRLDPVYGRDFEVRQLVDILTRRRQNNPILTGEAGVGKTAVVEGFAARVAAGDVPAALRGVAVHSLDLTLLQAGAGVKGEFENRLKTLINEVKSSSTPIILFIDEAHTLIGAGGQAGQGDAANILKPALARGELRTIAATTWSEYKKYFERDPALTRRFQVVKVEEPGTADCELMLRSVVPTLEKHHRVRIQASAVQAAVRLSSRFITGRQLPDKAVSVLDTACARLSIGQDSTPGIVEELRRRLENLDIESQMLSREEALGQDHSVALQRIVELRAGVCEDLDKAERQWRAESVLVKEIRAAEERAAALPVDAAPERAEKVRCLSELNGQLAGLQGDAGLVRVSVDPQTVAEVVSGWTGIPAGRMMRDEIQSVLSLGEQLKKRVLGQNQAIDLIAECVQSSRANVNDPNRPVGVFLLVGPSGVGKTETAIALADALYGGEKNLITINMSEFKEPHTVSTLKGAPPGYVGYGEGGVLTEAVRKRPYSVVLLDEAEKAHPAVLEAFYRVFDKGVMEDGEGREIVFRNCLIILTSNAASEQMAKLCADPDTMPSPAGLIRAVRPELLKIFKPAFLGRLIPIPYYPIGDESLRAIVRLNLEKLAKRVSGNSGLALTYDPGVIDALASRCTEVESGARNVDSILTNTVVPEISRMILGRMAAGEPVGGIHIGLSDGSALQYSAR